MEATRLWKANLSGANLKNAGLSQANLSDADLYVDPSNANISPMPTCIALTYQANLGTG